MVDPYGDLRKAKPDPKPAFGRPTKPARTKKFDWQLARRMYEEGGTTVSVGRELGVSASSVHSALRRMGVQTRKNLDLSGLHASNAQKRNRTHCKNGHEYTDENTRWDATTSGRVCRACRRDRTNIRREASKALGVKRLPGWTLTKKGEDCCRNCGSGDRVQLHHAIPRSKSSGPSRSDLRNGIALCHSCHFAWHGKRAPIYRDLFTIEEWAFISSVELTGELIEAWLDKNYPVRPLEDAA